MVIKNKAEKMRFGLVGGANTIIDFGVLFGLTFLGIPAIFANIVSTATAFCFSFLANRKYTFRSTGENLKREISLFITVTLFGLWVIQTIVIQGVKMLLDPLNLSDETVLLIAKMIATIASLIWNYVLYSRVVFSREKNNAHRD